MFNGFTQRTIDFMWNLRLNNTKAWFEENKEDFRRDFQTPMKELGIEVNRIVSGYKFLMPFYDYFITLDNDPEPPENKR